MFRDLRIVARELIAGAWNAWPWRHRYQAVVIGRESGNRSPVNFVRFTNVHRAMRWTAAMNGANPSTLTYWDYEPIPRGE